MYSIFLPKSSGNLELIHQSSIDIPLGEVTIVQFNGSSPICPNGPFIYNIKESKYI